MPLLIAFQIRFAQRKADAANGGSSNAARFTNDRFGEAAPQRREMHQGSIWAVSPSARHR